MTRVTRLGFLFILLSSWILAGNPAAAQSQPPIVLGVVDLDVVLAESKAATGLRASMKKLEDGFKVEIKKQEDQFRAAIEKIQAQQANLSEAELKKKLADHEAAVQAANAKFREKEQQLQARRDKALGQIKKTIIDIVEQIANERGLTLVLNKFDVIFSAEAYELTPETLKRLDAKLPSVKL
jgi:Skp family chaperone for outer membrane proteins